MKKINFLLLIVLILSLPLSSIAQSSNEKKLHFGAGIGIGFFHPGDVNDHISDALSAYTITTGVEDIFTFYALRGAVAYEINKNIDLTGTLELAFAPKWIITDGDDFTFSFNRVSPGIVPKFHLPLKSGRHSLYFAPGLFYHFMSFEGIKANNIGFRAQGGLSFNFGNFNLQPFVSFDYAKAKDDDFELNYTGLQIGADFYFGK